MKECLIVIPTLNPNDEFIHYVRDLISNGYKDILIIDDGSEEKYKSVFAALSILEEVIILSHKENKGKGAALKNAFDYFEQHNQTNRWIGVITVDSDGQHLVKDVNRLYKSLQANPSSLVLGVRDFDLDHVPTKSRLGNKITKSVFKWFYGKAISDTQTGLRAISASLIPQMLSIKGERFDYEINMLIWAVEEKVHIDEIMIETVYRNNNDHSHFRPVVDSFKIYRYILSSFLIFLSIAVSSFIIDFSLFQLLIVLFGSYTSAVRIPLASVGARLCSSLYNYSMNKKFVFENQHSVKQSIFKYYLLMICEITVSTVAVFLIYRLTFLPEILVKVMVDSAIFIVSFFAQKYIVFRSED